MIGNPRAQEGIRPTSRGWADLERNYKQTKKMEKDHESHLNPLAPPTKRSSKCFVYTLLAVVLQSIAFLIFSLVVLRINAPTLRLSNATVNQLNYGPTSLNMTVVAGTRLRNMNFGRFEFRSGNTILMYENATIGAASIHEGRVDGRENREMNVTLKVNYMNFSIDIGLLGLVKLRSFAELRGEVRVVKIINRGKSAVMNCTMDLNLTSQVIQDLSCQ
ncbi:hypothetical protein DH2020_005657 [Rehmannia glutinosa]|uniref:Late embryogenesis abundant protein LEA-2 subgroup domain-containing protein n=1 Tax=Rehmannia glutinosa TaxID=99300 RepID=A0ABR0XGL5_REHGL